MRPTRPPYPPELAREFEPTAQTIQNWVYQARDQGLRQDGLQGDEREELCRLRHENMQLCIKREILSKHVSWGNSTLVPLIMEKLMTHPPPNSTPKIVITAHLWIAA